MKRLFVLLGIGLLCAGLLLYSLTETSPQPKEPTTEPTAETETIVPSLPGQVRFVNEDPQQQAAWEKLAAEFTGRTGLEVTVIERSAYSAEVGEPTLFTLTDGDDLSQWGDVCLDLSCTAGYSQLASWELALQSDGKICGIAVDVECYGLAYNATLLAQAGYTRADIGSFEDLQTVVRSITANSKELGFAAFGAPDMDGTFTGHFSGLTGNLRVFCDLYINNTTQPAGGDGLSDLLGGEAVFYPAGTGDYESLAALGDHRLGFLPLYTGGEERDDGILHVQVHRYFCVRADAPEQDIEAALAFLSYLVHPREDGSVPLDDLGLLSPYRQTTFAANKLEVVFREEMAAGRACLNCAGLTAPEGLAQALIDYAAAPTDENWAKVAQLL